MIKPLGDKILVKPIPRVKSSIIEVIMEEADNMGTVIAVGPGRKIDNSKREDMPVKVGQFVRFGTMGRDSKEEYLKYQECFINNERHLVMSWQDVVFVQDDTAN
jgi:chaperonin GroES